MFGVLAYSILFIVGLALIAIAHGLWLEDEGHNSAKFRIALSGLIGFMLSNVLVGIYYPLTIPLYWKIVLTLLSVIFTWDVMRLRVAAGHKPFRDAIVRWLWVRHMISGMYRSN